MEPYERIGGAHESHYDPRTRRHDTSVAAPLMAGGYAYGPEDILDQNKVGKCTAISPVQNANKALGKKFSDDFQYLCQKKFYDLDWDEGSSIFNALKVGKNIGFLPAALWTHTTVEDSKLPYSAYIAKLRAIPDAEIERLKGLVTDKLAGYAIVPQLDAQSLAKAILDSKSGILCRYTVGEEWWTAPDGRISWATVDIDPIRPPLNPIDGHAIGASAFDFHVVANITHPNTWGPEWNDKNQGNCHINHNVYKCTEAWIPYYNDAPAPLPAPFIFTQDMHYSDVSNDVFELQKRLIAAGYQIPSAPTKLFGNETRKALIAFQDAKGISLTFLQRFIPWFAVAGPATRAYLNSH